MAREYRRKPPSKTPSTPSGALGPAHDCFLRGVRIRRDDAPDPPTYPFSIPAIRAIDSLDLDPRVTFFVGENGSGKSTLIEAIAVAAGFNAEGGSKNFNFATRRTESPLWRHLTLIRGTRRPNDGFFFRAESFYNVATEIERLQVSGYGDRSLHDRSHGEAFLELAAVRFRGRGVYILDEPESALSPARQLSLLTVIDRLVRARGSQLLIATHSPIILSYPRATIYELDGDGIRTVEYEDTEHFRVTKDFLSARDSFFQHLFLDPIEDPADEGDA